MNNFISKVVLTTSIILTSIFLLPKLALSDNSDSVKNIAGKITVRVFPDGVDKGETGSGVIIQKDILEKKTTYFILTNDHVINFNGRNCGTNKSTNIEIQTPDKMNHKATIHENTKILCESKKDLAILTFSIDNSLQKYRYETAKISKNISIKDGEKIYISGFPCVDKCKNKDVELLFQSGNFTQLSDPQKDGYQLGYGVATQNGMSGGAVLNNNGELIGIHGKGISNNTAGSSADELKIYTLQEASPRQKKIIKSNAWAIPSSSFLHLLPTRSNSIENILSAVSDNQSNTEQRLNTVESKINYIYLLLAVVIILLVIIVFLVVLLKRNPRNTDLTYKPTKDQDRHEQYK
jgi:S1-C subfamily serine protease